MKIKILSSFQIALLLIAICSIATAQIKQDEIILYWPLDDGKGDQATDASGRDHHGTITSGKWVDGMIDGGLEFDGVSTFIHLDHHDDFNLPNGYTIAVWAKINNLPNDHIGIPRKEKSYILHPSKAGDGYNFHTYVYTDGSTHKLVHGDVVKFEDWHYLAGTYDGNIAKSWIDGEVVVEMPVTGKIDETESPLRWSNDCCGGRMLDGILDEIAIISRALNQDEMKQLMTQGLKALSVDAKGKLASRWAEIKKSR